MFPGHSRESSGRRREVKYLLYLFVVALWIGLGPVTSLPAQNPAAPAVDPNAVKLPTGLSYKDLLMGTGAAVGKGSLVTVHYTGRFTNGKIFDESHDEKAAPFVFVQGVSQMIPGWTMGVAGMQAGGRRQITVPPSLAYGTDGVRGAIPAGATLIYDITVVKVE